MSSYGLSTKHDLGRLLVLIPAWQPDDRLLSLVGNLRSHGFGAILVVDDGSSGLAMAILGKLQRDALVVLVRHEDNLGKGRALKTGLEFVLREMPGVQGVITADADGQHTAMDVVRVAYALRGAGASIVLGVRAFTGAMPLRCKVGNWLTRGLFRWLTGARLSDTQTGLRGIPRSLIQELSAVAGERYEYEMAVLTHLCRTGRQPIEVQAETVYLDGNRSSHFRPVLDSVRILLALARCVVRS